MTGAVSSSRAFFRALDAGVEDADERLGQRFLDEVDFAERERAFLELAVEEFIHRDGSGQAFEALRQRVKKSRC